MYQILEPCPKFVGAAAIDDRLGGQGQLLAGVVNEFYASVTERLYKQAEEIAKIIGDLNRRLNKRLKSQDQLLRQVTEHYRKTVGVNLQENYAKLTHVAQNLATESGRDPAFVAPGSADFTPQDVTKPEIDLKAPLDAEEKPLEATQTAPVAQPCVQAPQGSISAAVELRRCLEAAQAVLAVEEIAAVIEAAGKVEPGSKEADPVNRPSLWDYLLGRRPVVEILPADRPGVLLDLFPGLELSPAAAAAVAPPPGPVSPSLRAQPAACDAPSFALITLGSF